MLKAGTAARRQSLRGTVPAAAADIRSDVEQFLGALDRRLQEHDPQWVGHAKLLLSDGDHTCYASITAAGDQPRWAGDPRSLDTAETTIYVAAYGLSDSDVAAAVDGTLASVPILAFPGVAAG
jgi:hypothetical protein